LDDTQGRIPPALAEKLYELLRTPYRRTAEDANPAKFAESPYSDVGE
jgi:hypothetical protein